MVDGPLVDGRTGASVLVVSSPVPGHGIVVAFLDLDAVGPALTATLGGPRHLEFVVTNADGSRALSRSIDPARWVGPRLAGTPFAGGSGAGAGEHADLDGSRLGCTERPPSTASDGRSSPAPAGRRLWPPPASWPTASWHSPWPVWLPSWPGRS